MDDDRKAAYEALNDAAEALVSLVRVEDDEGETITDTVLIVGTQWYDGDGDRCGRIMMFPRNGSQPYYITAGMLQSGLRHLEET